MDFAGFGGEGGGVEDCLRAFAPVIEGHFGEAELGVEWCRQSKVLLVLAEGTVATGGLEQP